MQYLSEPFQPARAALDVYAAEGQPHGQAILARIDAYTAHQRETGEHVSSAERAQLLADIDAAVRIINPLDFERGDDPRAFQHRYVNVFIEDMFRLAHAHLELD